jgi:sugar phosphate isomerase/epimerase
MTSAAPDLIAGYWTIAGPIRPGDADDVSPWPIAARIAAARAAGFTGIGFYYDDLIAIDRAGGVPDLRAVLHDQQIRVGQFELGVAQWWGTGAERGRADAMLERLLELIGRLDLPDVHIKALPELTGTAVPIEEYASGLRTFAAAAADIGAPVGLEFLPYSTISTADRAVEVVSACQHPNAGIVIDTWHVARGGTRLSSIAALAAARIVNIELNDVQEQAATDLGAETIDSRKYPGEGTFDWSGFLDAVRETGYDRPFGVEVLSDEQRSLDITAAAVRAYETTAAVLRSPIANT